MGTALRTAGGTGAKESLCGTYNYPGAGNPIAVDLYYQTRDGALSDPNIDATVQGEYLQLKAWRDGSSWSKGVEVTAKKPFSGVLYTSLSNGVFQTSQEVTYNAGDVVISFTSKIGSFVLKIK